MMKKQIAVLLCIMALLCFYVTAEAADFCVQTVSEFQNALLVAATNTEGDQIHLVQGTIMGSFVYSASEAKSLTIEGGYTAGCGSREPNPANTILDGDNAGAVLVLVCTQAADFVVDGLTLQNGNSGANLNGGGLYVDLIGGNITVRNTAIIDNTATGSGGGVCVNRSNAVTFTNNTVSDNLAAAYDGGGVYIKSCKIATFSDNTIIRNTADDKAGGLFIHGAFVSGATEGIKLSGNTINGNTTRIYGGGVYIDNGALIDLVDNTISHNSASLNYGGGIFINASSAAISLSGNSIHNNIAGDRGGGIYLGSGKTLTLVNNVIFANSTTDSSSDGGAGIYIRRPNAVTLTHNTVCDNASAADGGGLWLELYADNSAANIYNNIVWNNSAVEGGDIYINNDPNNNYIYAAVNLYNNDFDPSTGGFYIAQPPSSFAIDASNLNNLDPFFANPSSGDYHLRGASACINKGDNLAPELPADDKDVKPRINGPAADLGAFEYAGPALPVASFSADPISGIVPLAVTFMDASSGIIDTRAWDFGDGNSSAAQNPSYTYLNPGNYTVSLTVTGPDGSTTQTDSITVQPSPPLAVAGSDTVIAGTRVTLDGSQSYDSDGEIVSYQWQLIHRENSAFDRTADGINPTLSDLQAGFYDVILTVTDNHGAAFSDEIELAVAAEKKRVVVIPLD